MNESLNQPEPADRSAAAAAPIPGDTASHDTNHESSDETAAAVLSPGAQFLLVFPPIMLPMFLAVADQTIVATALPAIASGLGDIERASWVVVSYLIANTIAAPVYGRLGDTF